jgi:hypothetical protein
MKPTTIADRFDAHGHTTLHAMPGISRKGPRERIAFYGFDTTYRAWELGYKGPRFDWVPVPDQFVLHVLHQRDLSRTERPVFIQYDLVGSRPPWKTQPPYVDSWKTLGSNGEAFAKREPRTFDVEGLALEGAGRAYVHAIASSLRVLRSYLTERLPRDDELRDQRGWGRPWKGSPWPLFVVVGAHQPLAQVAGPDAKPLVPVHVISRDEELLQVFAERGYSAGMRPGKAPPLPLEGLLRRRSGK